MEEHRADNHKLETCTDCGKKMEIKLLAIHKTKCNNKPTICKYCELVVTKEELHDHEYMCGSKTELCQMCGDPVPLLGIYFINYRI
jgi:hypothetical protein